MITVPGCKCTYNTHTHTQTQVSWPPAHFLWPLYQMGGPGSPWPSGCRGQQEPRQGGRYWYQLCRGGTLSLATGHAATAPRCHFQTALGWMPVTKMQKQRCTESLIQISRKIALSYKFQFHILEHIILILFSSLWESSFHFPFKQIFGLWLKLLMTTTNKTKTDHVDHIVLTRVTRLAGFTHVSFRY